ncbi:hypothetical protein BKA65DRAFT_569498 [Rhexocercosporidium sp. MPI-PUGE-AT-0058]|nr:hypothetical protein BKA65DRAFT_569498 [Rhexocercosporidium sp. MPI-PUGE-AT-0058]
MNQGIQRAVERQDQHQGVAPAKIQEPADHQISGDMPKTRIKNSLDMKILSISKETAVLRDFHAANMEYLDAVDSVSLSSKPASSKLPVITADPDESTNSFFENQSSADINPARESPKILDTIEEVLETNVRQYHLLPGQGWPTTSSTTKDKNREARRRCARNSRISDCGITDLEDQTLDSMYRFVGCNSIAECQDEELDHIRQYVSQKVLDPRRQALVEEIMEEFWQIWDSNWSQGVTQCAGQSPSSAGEYGPPPAVVYSSAETSRQQKRQRQGSNEDDDNDETEGDLPRRPTKRTLPSGKIIRRKKFACPFRKHNPEKYNINNYRTCALTPLDDISRLKSHLYRVYVTNLEARVCGPQAVSRDFEEPKEQILQTPDSLALHQYETYIQSTVPVLFLSRVELAARNFMQPVEASFLRELDFTGLIRSYLEEGSREYREKHLDENTSQLPVTVEEQSEASRLSVDITTAKATATADPANVSAVSIKFLDIMQPLPLQPAQYGLDSSTTDKNRGAGTQANMQAISNSAYGSGISCFCTDPCTCRNFAGENQPLDEQLGSSLRDNFGDGGEQMLEDGNCGLDGAEDVDWNSYLESQALFGINGISGQSHFQ